MTKKKKNTHVDLFKDMIPAVDMRLTELWDAASEEGRKEIKADLWNLNRYISSIKENNSVLQEHYVLAVNEFYNKHWKDIAHHPQLQWLTLCICGHDSKQLHFHEWIPLGKEPDKKTALLLKLFPNKKKADIETLSNITSEKEIKQYCEDLGWEKKEINALKL